MGDGEWGIEDWPQSPIPKPQSPIPNPQKNILIIKTISELKCFLFKKILFVIFHKL